LLRALGLFGDCITSGRYGGTGGGRKILHLLRRNRTDPADGPIGDVWSRGAALPLVIPGRVGAAGSESIAGADISGFTDDQCRSMLPPRTFQVTQGKQATADNGARSGPSEDR